MDKDIKGRKDTDKGELIDPDDAAEIVAEQLASILLNQYRWKKQFKKGKSRRFDYWFF